MLIKSILIFAVLISCVLSQNVDSSDEELTTENSENCVTVHNCCERYDDECIVYCEPVIECKESQIRSDFIYPRNQCLKGYKKIRGKCRKIY
jgi:hypothetical protein